MSVGLQVFSENGTNALDITDGLVRLGGVISTQTKSGLVKIANPHKSKIFVFVLWRSTFRTAQIEITITQDQISWRYPNPDLYDAWVKKNGADLHYGFCL